MTLAAAEATASAHIADAALLSKLAELLAKTTLAHDLLVKRQAPSSTLLPLRQNLAQIHIKLGHHHLAAGELPKAIENGRQANTLLPDDREAMLLAVQSLLAANNAAAALPILARASKVHTTDAAIHALLAQVYGRCDKPTEAVQSFRRAVALRPGDITLTVAFADALTSAGEVGEALSVWRQVLAVVPDNADYLWRFGALCNDAGAFDDARAAFARLIRLAPGRGLYHRLLGKLKTYVADDPHIGEMEGLVARAASQGDDARELHFALFNACEAVKDYDRAFSHLKAANDIRKAQINYRPDVINRVFDSVEAAFAPATRPSFASSPRTESPIFIVGMPRSGSTLVEQILDSHPDASAAGEATAFGAVVEKHLLQSDLTYDLRPLGDAGAIRGLGDAYLAAIGRTADTRRRTVDKYLTNFLSIGIIKAVFPVARIVHCHRNPLANCFSAYASHFETDGLGFKADMEETARYYVRYHRLMQFWKRLYGDEILDLSYEQLTLDQEAETRRLIAYCGLGWNAACMDFHKNDRAVKTASYMQVRQPIYSGVDRRTGHYLQHLGPMIRILREAGLHPVEAAG